MSTYHHQPTPITKRAILACVALFVLACTLLVGGCAGVKSFTRYQHLQDAKNRTRVVHQQIKTAAQQADVVRAQIAATKAKAEQRYQESVGIRRAQDEISRTLTPLYVQHEAIQAQEHGGAAKIYIPVGPQGIPLVSDVADQASEPGR